MMVLECPDFLRAVSPYLFLVFFKNVYSGFTFTHVLPAINRKNNENIEVLKLYKVFKLVESEGYEWLMII